MVRIHLGLPLFGDVAQLVEHLVCNQEVVGSSPIVSTSELAKRGEVVKATLTLAQRRRSSLTIEERIVENLE